MDKESIGKSISENSGFQNMMSNPLMSAVFKQNPARAKAQQKDSQPKSTDEKQDQVNSKKDPNFATIGPGEESALKVGDSTSNILGKMYNFMLKKYERESDSFADWQKFNNKVEDVKEDRVKELIGLFGGKYEKSIAKKEKEKTGIQKVFEDIKDAISSLKGKGKPSVKAPTPKAPKAPEVKVSTPKAPEVKAPTPKAPTAKPAGVPSVPKPTAVQVTPKVIAGATVAAAAAGGLLMPSETVASVINKASDMVGVDKALMYAMAKQESGFDPNAGAKTSSAKGLYQFIKGTWNGMVKQYGSKYPILKERGPEDPEANAIAGALFIKENSDYLAKNGIPVNATTIYAAHFLGPRGAKKLLSADPETNASTLMPDAAAANDFIFYEKTNNKPDKSKPRTVQQVINVLFEKVGQYQEKYQKKLNSPTSVAPVSKVSEIPNKLPNNTSSGNKTTVVQQNNTNNVVHGGTTMAAADTGSNHSPFMDKQYNN